MSRALLHQPRSYDACTSINTIALPIRVEATLDIQLPGDHTCAAGPKQQALLIADLPDTLTKLRDLDPDDLYAMPAFLLAAFTIFLARYTAEQSVRLSVADLQVFNRGDRALPLAQPAAGMLEIDLTDTLTFEIVLQRMRERLNKLSDLPTDEFAAAALPYDAHTVGFSYQRIPNDGAHAIPGAVAELTGDLRLEIVGTKRDLQARWGYRTEHFATATIARMHDHFQTMLTAIMADPRQPISDLALLTAADQYQMLVEWNATAAQYRDTECIHELFEEQVRRQPLAPALTFEDTVLSYHELNARANQLAHYLQRLGVGPETLVGICVERSIEMVVGMLGVLKAGGAYVPLDPNYPIERLSFMLADAQMPVILTQQTLNSGRWLREAASADLSDQHAPNVIYLDRAWAQIAQESALDPHSATTPDNLAYVIYTSGSTGRPKGTLLEHRGLCNLVMAQQQAFGMGPGKRVLQFASCSFDASVWELVMALATGATLCLARREVLSSIPDLLSLLRDQAITTATLPPSLLALLPAEDLPNLTTVVAAGEACTPNLIARWAPGRQFFNAYGPTEATVCASWHACAPNEQRTPPIGRPLPNVQLYILDRYQRPVPIGTPGELHIGGVSLARGYLNRPDLTAERFIMWSPELSMDEDASLSAPSMRLYKTGDLARYRPDGSVEFLGRIDDQVKLRGFRIELGEIEATLRWHPAVQDAIVLVREEQRELQRLVAYVVLDEQALAINQQELRARALDARASAKLDMPAQLRTYLREKLPDYMVPSVFVPVKTLPLTPNGKVDRRALPAPEDTNMPVLARRTPDETVLAQIWAQVLGRAHMSINDDFFALGGHSLLAAQAIALIRMHFTSHTIPLTMLYEAPTVAAFARALQGGNDQPAPAAPIDLTAEIVLDTSIMPPATARQPLGTAPKALFITGVTGFLGAFLLHELLVQTKATIYCLVRATDTQDANRRIQQTLSEYQIWHTEWRDRIVPVVGDLRHTQFGLSTAMFEQLASNIDVIYHAGAQVNYLHPYAALKHANVLGSVEVLRLAALQRIKPVHYISSIAVAAMTSAGMWNDKDERNVDTHPMGYAQSKWVAEGIMRLAQTRGMPVAIYRPGRIGSHSQTGAANLDDSFVRLLAGCVQLGLAPNIALVENLVPVDYAAQMIVHLSRQPALQNETFHLLNPQSITWQWVADAMQDRGYPFELVPYQEWHRALMQVTTLDSSHPLLGLLMLMPQQQTATSWIDPWANQQFEARNSLTEFAGSAIHCPTVDAIQLERTLADSQRRGIFSVPAAQFDIDAEPVLISEP